MARQIFLFQTQLEGLQKNWINYLGSKWSNGRDAPISEAAISRNGPHSQHQREWEFYRCAHWTTLAFRSQGGEINSVILLFHHQRRACSYSVGCYGWERQKIQKFIWLNFKVLSRTDPKYSVRFSKQPRNHAGPPARDQGEADGISKFEIASRCLLSYCQLPSSNAAVQSHNTKRGTLVGVGAPNQVFPEAEPWGKGQDHEENTIENHPSPVPAEWTIKISRLRRIVTKKGVIAEHL